MIEQLEAIVIGSGFGGSVMAYRLAKEGKRVCLLERGKAYPPGSFSRTPFEVSNNFWDPSDQHYGLFNIWSFKGMSAIVSSGLGGGSLIYANVLIRKDSSWFRDSSFPKNPVWPIDRRALDPHYDAVEQIMLPSRYPIEYQRDNKTAAMREAALNLGYPETSGNGAPAKPQWYLPELAVTFNLAGAPPAPGQVFDPGSNYHRAPRETCRLCGECDVGCNYGSKNTLDYNYITLAQNHGADIRPMTEVKSITPNAGGGFTVTCVKHSTDKATTPGAVENGFDLIAKKVILSAGTFGSTYLLLKMKQTGLLPRISDALGTRFSGNGDLLMFVTRCKNGDGSQRRLNPSRAPVITSTFRFPDDQDDQGAGRGFYLQDAGYPLALDYVWEMLDRRWITRVIHFLWTFVKSRLFGDVRGDVDRQISDLVGGGEESSTSMPLLGMGRDVADGQMSVRLDPRTGVPLLQLDWDDRRSRPYIKQAFRRGKEVAEALGGRFTGNPLTWLFNDLITVHPLGGCPMATSPENGVVDPHGRVFNYPGLYVADGSIMPGPVGANPSFTIAALSDRVADAVLADP